MTFAAIVLAAGSSTRFGGDKLSALLRGKPLVHHAIAAAREAPVDQVIVVKRGDLNIGQWHGAPTVQTVEITSDALSASLQAGIGEVTGTEGAFIFLGDMPLIPPAIAAKLAAALDDNIAAIPVCKDERGHPVLLSARAFPLVAQLTGDEGAGRLLKQRTDVVLVETEESGVLLDIDRKCDLKELEKSRS